MLVPSYFLILGGFLAVLTAGAALQEMIKQAWLREEKLNFPDLLVPYLAMCAGFIAMMASGLQIFGIPAAGAYGFTVPFILALAGFVWWRLTVEISGGGGSSW
ncbi:hypothetical protein [Gloeobacter morelensis]|uniref:Uncharacterized protein n=1 Tax=Gloeobacter morelensis MG652769 TaxID=2781736 RepID=A0ABY3PLT0_9CYAN|nr:hypothetical protein [Gloeobacter morelensis]UFP94554.1 hypothetical protein ISF26_22920 [Gloeobacter morelensis MG652769]